MLSRGNEVANRTNFVAVHESGIAAWPGAQTNVRCAPEVVGQQSDIGSIFG
jgi:hypothetical protein